jgi:hypothetical protein
MKAGITAAAEEVTVITVVKGTRNFNQEAVAVVKEEITAAVVVAKEEIIAAVAATIRIMAANSITAKDLIKLKVDRLTG